MSTEQERSLKHNVGWMFVGQGTGYVLRVVYFILIARALGVMEYGVVAAAFALVSLVAQYSRLGSGMVLLRYVSADRDKFSIYWGNVLITTVAVSGFITIALRLVAPHILATSSASLVVFTSVASCVFEQITISATQVFQAFQKMRFTALLNLLTSLLRTVAAGVLLFFVHHATALEWVVLSMIVSGIAALAGVVAVTASFGMPRLDMRLFRARTGEGVEYAFAASTNSAYDDLDKTMLSHYGMTAAIGIYAMAYRIIEMATMPITSIQLATEPRLFALGPDGIQESAALGKKLLSRSLMISTAIAIILFFTAPLLPLLVGRSFSEGISALRWLCVIPIFRSVHHITGSVLTCAGKQRARTLNQIAAALLNFLANLWLIPRFGWLGAAWASLFTDAALGALNWSVLRQTLRRDALSRATKINALASPELAAGTLGDGRVASFETSTQGDHASFRPLVSIVIPYYKQEAFLQMTVQSAKQQSYARTEIIVVDDGSPVSARSVLGDDPEITIVRSENQGVSAARNLGSQCSSGEFLIFLDSDDVLEPDAVAAHLSAFHTRPDAGMSFGALRVIDQGGLVLKKPHICRPRRSYLRVLLASNPIGCPGAAMMRREYFTRAGGFDESFKMGEDYLLYLKLTTMAALVRHTDCVVAYRQHESGISRDKHAMLRGTLAALDRIESLLSQEDKKCLPHARRRWRHEFLTKPGVAYRIVGVYYRFRAMLTVPVSSYFGRQNSAIKLSFRDSLSGQVHPGKGSS